MGEEQRRKEKDMNRYKVFFESGVITKVTELQIPPYNLEKTSYYVSKTGWIVVNAIDEESAKEKAAIEISTIRKRNN